MTVALTSAGAPAADRCRSPRVRRRPGGGLETILGGVARKVIHMSLEEFERGLVLPPTGDEVSITVDGRRLHSKDAVLAWWADVAAEIEVEEAARHASPGA